MSYQVYNAVVAPTTPASGKSTEYVSTAGEPHFINDQGIDANLISNQKKNYIRNSGMWFAQRQAPATPTVYSTVGGRLVTADGWGISNENASAQYARVDTASAAETGLAGRFYGQFTKLTSAGKLAICQVIEGTDSSEMRGQNVRVQFWAKGIVTASATWRVGLVQLTNAASVDTVPSGAGQFLTAFGVASTDPTLGGSLIYTAPKATVTPDNGTIVGTAANVTVTSAGWQRFGAVFTLPTTFVNLTVMIWSDAQVAATAGISISQVSLTVGQEIQDWVPPSTQVELARVQRYYCKSFNVDTAPVQNAGLVGVVRGAVSVAGAIAAQPVGIRFPVALRAGASVLVTFYNPSAANAFVRNTTAGTDSTTAAPFFMGENGGDCQFTGIAAWTASQSVAVHYTADVEL